MKITIHSTSKVITLNGLPARIWEGMTDKGIKIHCYVAMVGIDKDEDRVEEFKRDLLEQEAPSAAVEVIPLRVIL